MRKNAQKMTKKTQKFTKTVQKSPKKCKKTQKNARLHSSLFVVRSKKQVKSCESIVVSE